MHRETRALCDAQENMHRGTEELVMRREVHGGVLTPLLIPFFVFHLRPLQVFLPFLANLRAHSLAHHTMILWIDKL